MQVLFQNLEVQMARGVWVQRGACVSHAGPFQAQVLQVTLYSFKQREGDGCGGLCSIPGPLEELNVCGNGSTDSWVISLSVPFYR